MEAQQQQIIAVSPKVTTGIGTIVGIIVALGQYGGALVLFLEASDQNAALAPLITATATLITVIAGRMHQAATVTKAAGMAAASVGPARLMPPDLLARSPDPTVGQTSGALDDAGGPVERGLGRVDAAYTLDDDIDPVHEQRDIHDAEEGSS